MNIRLKIWSKLKLIQIRTDAKKSLYNDFNGRVKNKKTVNFYLYGIPYIVTIFLLFFNVFIDKDVTNYLIAGISIFAGLFFGLLFTVNEKYNSRKKVLIQDNNEESINYLKRYKYFSTQLISQISYVIVICIVLIIIMSMIYFSSDICNSLRNFLPHELEAFGYIYFISKILDWIILTIKYIINGTVFYLISQLLLFIFVILSSTYVLLMDDIDFDE